ncbi:hypothetical protein [Campylobacter helveticus]|uniref:hypothetical protein n=1 Tax=Campylobacter helveticus TaxID=28898 RepID=UPI0022EA31A2|nr:hypothetical protein [Campylobacter helveticus]
MKPREKPNFYQILKFTHKHTQNERVEKLLKSYELEARENKRPSQSKDKFERLIYEDDMLKCKIKYEQKAVEMLSLTIYLPQSETFCLLDKFGIFPLHSTNTSCFTIIGSSKDKSLYEKFKQEFESFDEEKRLRLVKSSRCEKEYKEFLSLDYFNKE